MATYKKEASELLVYLGGKDNIKSLMHCMTRLRFVLVDESKVDLAKVKAMPIVKGIFNQSGQFQVIIGNEVQSFYHEFVKESQLEKNKEEMDTKQTKLQIFMSNFGEIFAPLIPAIICGGLVLGFHHLMMTYHLFEKSRFLFQFGHTLLMIGNAIFALMPVGIVWSIVKKSYATEILGLALGFTMIISKDLDVSMISASIFAGFTFVYLEKYLKKITPDSISILIVPFFSLVFSVFLTQLVFIPFGNRIDLFISTFVFGILSSNYGWLFALIFGLIYANIVRTGLHHFTNFVDLVLIAKYGGTIFWPMLALSNIAQGSSALSMGYLQKEDNEKRKFCISACTSCYLGITEPAMFGVNLKYHFPFNAALIGTGVAASVAVYFRVMAFSIGVGGIPGLLSIQTESVKYFILSILIAMIVPFTLTYIIGKKKTANSTTTSNEKFISPLEGSLLKLSEIDDQVFSQGLMGDGFAVELESSEVISPFDGEVVMTFPTKHAYGLKSNDGLEVLIHLGMDTVVLNGVGFECFVKVGEKIKQGQLLVKVDLEYIKSQQKSLVSPVIFTSGEKINLLALEKVKLAQKVIEMK